MGRIARQVLHQKAKNSINWGLPVVATSVAGSTRYSSGAAGSLGRPDSASVVASLVGDVVVSLPSAAQAVNSAATVMPRATDMISFKSFNTLISLQGQRFLTLAPIGVCQNWHEAAHT